MADAVAPRQMPGTTAGAAAFRCREKAFTQFAVTATTSLLRAAFVLFGTREEAEHAVRPGILQSVSKHLRLGAGHPGRG
jgi:hypothetical protein